MLESPYILAAVIVGAIIGSTALMVLWIEMWARISNWEVWGVFVALSPLVILLYYVIVRGIS